MTSLINRLFKSKNDIPGRQSYMEQIPDFGPLEIDDYNEFLKKSKDSFNLRWNSHFTNPHIENYELELNHFNKIRLLGMGSFGSVYLVQNELTGNFHAMKAIAKETIWKYKQHEHTRTEKRVLYYNNNPFLLHMQYFFLDNSYIYFIVPFLQGGELYSHLRKKGKFDEQCAMFYVSQVILALEYLHYVDIIYRDIKPENILIDHMGYLKLADFGFCKHMTKGRTYTLCGTPEYLAPEVILSKGYSKPVDWWGVGILTYELNAGFTPFKEKKAIKVYDKVLNGAYKMPVYFSEDLKNLIRSILQADTTKRLGNLKNGVNGFKDHQWFRPINWQAVFCRKITAPYKPDFEGPADTKHFRNYSYKSLVIDTEDKYKAEFENF